MRTAALPLILALIYRGDDAAQAFRTPPQGAVPPRRLAWARSAPPRRGGASLKLAEDPSGGGDAGWNPFRKKSGDGEDEDEDESKNLLQQVKDAGTAGAIAYALWEAAFWGLSIPVCVVGYRQVTGAWPDLSDGEDVKKLGVEAFAFVNLARFAVPLRIGLALGSVPWVEENILRRFGNDEAAESEGTGTIIDQKSGEGYPRGSQPSVGRSNVSSTSAETQRPEEGYSYGSRPAGGEREGKVPLPPLSPDHGGGGDGDGGVEESRAMQRRRVPGNNGVGEPDDAAAAFGGAQTTSSYLDSLSRNAAPRGKAGTALAGYPDALSSGHVPAPSSLDTAEIYLDV